MQRLRSDGTNGNKKRPLKYHIRWGVFIRCLLVMVAGIAALMMGIKLTQEPTQAAPATVNSVFIAGPRKTESMTVREASAAPKAQGLLILVNWDHPVPYDRLSDLVPLGDVFGDEVVCVNPDGNINADAGAAASDMFLADQAQGIGKYKLVSAYRSIQYQDKLWSARVDDDPDYGSAPHECLIKVVPGRCSEHTTGLAIDILSEKYENSDEGNANTPEGQWLVDNAYRFGFILRYPKDKESITGVIFEPWNYRYVGKGVAQDIYEQGICLEEYLGQELSHWKEE